MIDRRRIIIGVAVTCVLLGDPLYAQFGGLGQVFPRSNPLSGSSSPHPAVVRVYAKEQDATSTGSGTLIGVRQQHGLVVTNWHVIRDASGDIVVVFPDGFQSSARVLKVDRDWDLAALLIWRPRTTPIPIATQPPRPGDALTIAGYGQGRYRAVTAQCTQFIAPGPNFPYEMVEVSVQAREGDSGGPILNNRGELAGVLFGAARGTTAGSQSQRVRTFLADVWPSPSMPESNPAQIASRPTFDGSATPSYQPHPEPKSELQRTPIHRLPGTRERPPRVATSQSLQEDPQLFRISPNETAVTAASADSTAEQEPTAPATPDDVWQRLVGTTLFEKTKTALAAIGLMAIFWQISRVRADDVVDDEEEKEL